mgnify:FL=1
MPTRPVENPQRPGMGGAGITGLGDYPAFEGMEEWGAGDWAGTAAMNPWDVPESIPDDWRGDDWSLNFRPGNVEGAYGQYQDWAEGQGQDALPLDRFNDLQYQQGVGPIPDAPGPGADPAGLASAGYGLQFYPGQTANQDWRLQYGITGPGGDPTGWALSGGDPYGGFPWVSGDPSFVRQEEYNLPGNTNTGGDHHGSVNVGTETVTDVDKRPWNPDDTPRPTEFDLDEDPDDPAGGIPTHLDDLWMALTGQIPGQGDVARTMSEVPMVPPGWEDRTRVEVGQDPLSQGITSALAQLTGQSGGVADTPLARQSEQALRQIIFQGGRGAENLSDLGYTTTDALQEIIEAQGARAAETTTPLGDEVQQNLRALMASGGQLPDVKRRAMEMETLRDPIEAFRQAQLAQGQATMADRGLLGQGPELDYMQRLEGELAPMYAGAGQQLALGEAERADTRYREAMQQSNLMAMDQARLREDRLGMALGEAGDFSLEQATLREGRLSDALSRSTGWNEEAARNLVSAARAGTEHQQMLGDLAVQNIQENRLWNDMLYRAGIERATALDMIQRGNLNALLPVIQEYLQAASRIGDAYVTGSK